MNNNKKIDFPMLHFEREVQDVYVELWLIKHKFVFSTVERIFRWVSILAGLAAIVSITMVIVQAIRENYIYVMFLFGLWDAYMIWFTWTNWKFYFEHKKYPKNSEEILDNEDLRLAIIYQIENETMFELGKSQIESKIVELS